MDVLKHKVINFNDKKKSNSCEKSKLKMLVLEIKFSFVLKRQSSTKQRHSEDICTRINLNPRPNVESIYRKMSRSGTAISYSRV